jgi:NADH-quinone oxidoreductase subunit K
MLGNDPWLNNYLVLGAVLFSLGAVGFLTRRNLIVIFLCAELMLQGVSTTFVGFSSYHGTWGGQVGAIFSLALAAAEAGVDVSLWQTLRESEIAPIEDDVPTEGHDAGQPGPQWPKLSPAGRLPGVTQPSPTGSGSRTLAASPATREGVATHD